MYYGLTVLCANTAQTFSGMQDKEWLTYVPFPGQAQGLRALPPMAEVPGEL